MSRISPAKNSPGHEPAFHRMRIDLVQGNAAGSDLRLVEAQGAADRDIELFEPGDQPLSLVARNLGRATPGIEARLGGDRLGQTLRHVAGDDAHGQSPACPATFFLELGLQSLGLADRGSRSHRSTSRRGCGWPLIARLTSSAAGPVTPKWANSSELRRWARQTGRAASSLGSSTRTHTSGSVMPCSPKTHGAWDVIGTKAGRGGTIVCPRSAAQR